MFGNVGRKPSLSEDIQRVDFPTLMATQSRTLEQLLAHTMTGSQLASSVKHVEIAVRDLVVAVRASDIEGREALSKSLEEFAQDAKTVGRNLRVLSAKIDGTVDNVHAFNEYALRAISDLDASDTDPNPTTIELLISIMSTLSSDVAETFVGFTAVASSLDTLEEKLHSIRALTHQERVVIEGAVGDLLSKLWTIVGGNKAKLHQLHQRVDVLHAAEWYQTHSLAHIVATTETLLTIEVELSELRDKLSAPELVKGSISLEVHIASVERRVKRLSEGKLKPQADVSHIGIAGPEAVYRSDRQTMEHS
ncbi:hypothetical protein C8Q80DRAFT_1113433 [Daedaleopsis nitida]|nr:hypothetical protein C8Q80DRAFT_1113433 [Daedaleopsis nitida]